MAHDLSQKDDGSFEYAYLLSDGLPWHNLGQGMQDNLSIEEWKQSSGMNFEAMSAPVQFTLPDGNLSILKDKKVIYRGDNQRPMSVVGSGFQIVQPSEVMDFFTDLFALHDMRMSSAGVLSDGKRFFATAKTGNNFKLDNIDEVNGYLLVATAIDGTLATTIKFTSCRTVCANTLAVALNEKSKNEVKVSHKSAWNPKQVKIDLGLLDEGWANFKSQIEKLAVQRVSDSWASEFIRKMMVNKDRGEDQTTTTLNRIQEVENLYKNGRGADWSYGTKWGVLNAFTEAYTHGFQNGRKKSASSQFASSQFGVDEQFKSNVMNNLLELA